MRPWLGGLLLVACSGGRSDAEAYREALVSAKTFSAAQVACDGIRDAASRGDCQVTITERFGPVDETACAHVTDPVWLDECRFLLAERIGQTGDLPLAISVCKQSRFRRYCAWHLLQDAVDATLDQSAAEAEQVLEDFGGIPSLKDAPFQFWRIRFRELSGHGRSASEADCTGRTHQLGCEQALTRHVWELLEVVARRDRQRVCALPRGERVMNRGTPSWLPGPLTTAAEAQWESKHCLRSGASAGEASRTAPRSESSNPAHVESRK